MAEALKACPFCGCEKIVKSEYAPTREMTLFCSTCRAGVTRQRGSTETVWAARNRRPPVADAGSVGAEPVGWVLENLDEAWTREPDIAEHWRQNGWSVLSLFAAPPALGGWKPDREAVARKLAELRGHTDLEHEIVLEDGACVPVWKCYLKDADTIIALYTAPRGVEPFQDRVGEWGNACFGAEVMTDELERADRAVEEFYEALQTRNYPRERLPALEDYVWGRPVGETRQEIGGVMLTLAAWCRAMGVDMLAAGEAELARVWTKVETIRAKQAAKPTGSALPVSPPIAAAPKGEDEA